MIKRLCNILLATFFCFGNSYSQNSPGYTPKDVEFLNYFSDAGICLLKSQYSNALSLYEKCLSINPKSSASYYQIAKIHYLNKDYSAAELFAKRAVDLNKDNVLYLNLLSDIYIKNGEYELAQKSLSQVVKLYPSYDNYNALTDLYVSSGKFQEAVDLLNSFEQNYGFDTDISTRKSDLYRMMGRPQDAEKEILRLSASDPSNFYYLFLLSDLYFQTNQISKVQSVIDKMSKADSTNGILYLVKTFLCNVQHQDDCFYENLIKSLKSGDVPYEQKLMLVSQFSFSNEDFDSNQIDSAYKVLLNLYPDSCLVLNTYSDFLFSQYHYRESANYLKKSIDINKSDFFVWQKLIRVYSILEDYKKLDEISNLALSYYPELLNCHVYLSAASFFSGKTDEAEDLLLTAAMDFGDDNVNASPIYNYFCSLVNCKKGNVDKSLEYFKKFTELDKPDDYFAAQFVLNLTLVNQKASFSENILKLILSRDSSSPYFNYVYSRYLINQKDLKGAQYFIDKALSNNYSDIFFIYELAGDIYRSLNNCEKAVLYYNSALKNGGNTNIINNKIKKCN